ncbi:hypothetical protein [Gemmata sp.]|uniref:hypothetical protein n=1 Tax=Gemmata sp. TaxID=1914242 RepID=UPI003F6E7DD6
MNSRLILWWFLLFGTGAGVALTATRSTPDDTLPKVASGAPDDRVKRLQESCDRLAEDNKQLAGHILALRKDHTGFRDEQKKQVDKMIEEIDANKMASNRAITATQELKMQFESSPRLEWKSEVRQARLKTEFEVDFKSVKVIQAMAWIGGVNGNSIGRMHVAISTKDIKIQDSKVIVKYYNEGADTVPGFAGPFGDVVINVIALVK